MIHKTGFRPKKLLNELTNFGKLAHIFHIKDYTLVQKKITPSVYAFS